MHLMKLNLDSKMYTLACIEYIANSMILTFE